jgi:DNA-binding transcriptional ArsR family regulator
MVFVLKGPAGLPGTALYFVAAVRRCYRFALISSGRKAMPTGEGLPQIAHAIQLAIAPVFLLTGIAALLGVMANRLARVIDRGRALEESWRTFDEHARTLARAELVYLERRRKLASWSINYCTAAALLVCLVIALLFLDEFFAANLRWVEGVLFVLAMLGLIGGLASFLREVYLATHSMSIDPSRFYPTRDGP